MSLRTMASKPAGGSDALTVVGDLNARVTAIRTLRRRISPRLRRPPRQTPSHRKQNVGISARAIHGVLRVGSNGLN